MDSATPARTCSAPRCEVSKLIARGLCRRHYSRWQRTGSIGDDSPRKCAACEAEFAPTRTDQKHCSRACTTRAATRRAHGLTAVVPRRRKCRWCEAEFEHQDGRRAFCSTTCEAMTKRLQSVRHVFGLTTEQYRAMHLKHDGRCWICGNLPSGTRAFLCVDHDHDTGRVRGLLCDPCNQGIGFLRDDVELLRKAIAYLS